MGNAPRWKIYGAGEYKGAIKHLEDAARFVAGMEGWLIRDGHRGPILWVEGCEEFNAAESYDRVVETAKRRLQGR